MQLSKIIHTLTPCFTALSPDAALELAVTAMTRYGRTAIMALEQGKISGILTRTDVLRFLEQAGGDITEPATIAQVMTRNPVETSSDTTLASALEQMDQHQIEHLPVMAAGQLLTVVHIKQIMRRKIEIMQAKAEFLQEYIDNLHNASED